MFGFFKLILRIFLYPILSYVESLVLGSSAAKLVHVLFDDDFFNDVHQQFENWIKLVLTVWKLLKAQNLISAILTFFFIKLTNV